MGKAYMSVAMFGQKKEMEIFMLLHMKTSAPDQYRLVVGDYDVTPTSTRDDFHPQ